ncbi:bifunctional phosphopantothenoylcysteine decarboxylase/phosphopantothenate--cysteine ligase CoaBC [Anthocerotibacter panamensis]|uniref:bifunctional phosphopantothenoylcysteine decarboxylase/phosphopantothenate--cysteine ligase CoaBC n=1 Tax=Anthocerotibacter panamensis TaxID=2857077 RepID=UPI001C402C2A|nr:bifunctional phosphopantothenoylcysteine decarboxylase/phosphopantothenate--cysteine ligase CoaBC [Anthocerotibacter panamensis]
MPTRALTGPLLVGIGGGIAAYKVCGLVSAWAKKDAPVRAVLTASAERFITPLTLATLARHPAYTDADFWEPKWDRPLHILLGEWAGVIVLAPLTAQMLGQLAHGLADNLLTNILLASCAPVLLAPAMNTAMWEQKSVQRNLSLLLEDSRYHLLPPTSGRLACDTVGAGRMAEPEELEHYAQSLFWTQGQRDLVGKRVLVTGGGTREHLDPVRFLGNPATGRMALALAQAAFHRGAEVTVIHGPRSAPVPEYLTSYLATSAQDMARLLEVHFPPCDLLLMNAAVADVRPQSNHPQKLPKAKLPASLPLEPIPDLLAHLARHRRPGQVVVGFAAQTGDILTPAWEKLHAKGLDALFANPLDEPGSGFSGPTNQGWLLLRNGTAQEFPNAPKLAIAHGILDALKG